MTPDVRAARDRALAHLGIQLDAAASWADPWVVFGKRGPGIVREAHGWTIQSRPRIGRRDLQLLFSADFRAAPPGLYVCVVDGTPDDGTARVYAHPAVQVLRNTGGISREVLVAALHRMVEVPGALSACEAVAAVSGWRTAAQVLLDVTR